MKIYLSMASVGGWTIQSLSSFHLHILLSYYYDKNNLKRYKEENNVCNNKKV